MTNTQTSPGLRAGRREWTGLAVLTLPVLLLSLDLSVLFLALPHLSADLGADSTQQLWITDIYGFMLAGFLVTMGTLGDRIGRRRLLLTGAAAFSVASVVAAYSTSAEMLIVTRALMGIAGATLMPSTLALISNMFKDARQRGLAIAVWMSCFMGGMAFGPVAGGLLLENFWWGAAFLMGVPVMVLLMVLGPALLPEYRDPSQAGRLDLASVALSLATILPVIYGLKELAKHGWQPIPALAIIAGVTFGVAFVRRQRSLPEPLLDLRLFANRSFSSALGLNLVVGSVMGGTSLLTTLYLQMVEGLSPAQAGLWQLPSAVTMIVASMLAPVVARRVQPGFVFASGLVLASAGFALLTQIGTAGGLGILVTGFAIISVGVGIGVPLIVDMIVGSAPPEKAGSASSINETSGEFGIALGIAAIGSLSTAVYSGQLAIPAGVPAAAIQTARESIVGAAAVAGQLPAQLGAELLDSAHLAFTAGLNTVAGLATVLFLVLAAVAAVTLRPTRAADLDQSEPTSEQVTVTAPATEPRVRPEPVGAMESTSRPQTAELAGRHPSWRLGDLPRPAPSHR